MMRDPADQRIHFEDTMPLEAVEPVRRGGRARGRPAWLLPLVALIALVLLGGLALFAVRALPAKLGAPAAPTKSTPAAPASPAKPSGQATTLLVGNTGGDGVYIRRTPNMDDKIRAWPDRTLMTVVGPDLDANGVRWRHVKDPQGNVGYVPAQYLVESAQR